MRATIIISGLICQAFAANIYRRDQSLTNSKRTPQVANWTLPVAAAWIYMSDDQNYTTIPSTWSAINFSVVDVLYVGPAGVQPDGKFGFFNSNITGPLANRFKWILQKARSQNPNIKIIASQWWGTGLPGNWGSALSVLNTTSAINQYTDSVATFMNHWSSVSGGVDGYDIDYEDNNVLSTTPTILSQIRSKLDKLSSSLNGRQFYITISPSVLEYLDKAAPSIDYLNMQSYAGGLGLSPNDFMSVGLDHQQLLYGYCPETGCTTPSLSQVEDTYNTYAKKNQTLAGVHMYRLNSGNYKFEDQKQERLYQFLHP